MYGAEVWSNYGAANLIYLWEFNNFGEFNDFGKIYLKRDRSDMENQVLWSPIKFESKNDGTEITKTAFDKAYDRHNTDIKDITKT